MDKQFLFWVVLFSLVLSIGTLKQPVDGITSGALRQAQSVGVVM